MLAKARYQKGGPSLSLVGGPVWSLCQAAWAFWCWSHLSSPSPPHAHSCCEFNKKPLDKQQSHALPFPRVYVATQELCLFLGSHCESIAKLLSEPILLLPMNCILWICTQELRGCWLSRHLLWPPASGTCSWKPTQRGTESHLQSQGHPIVPYFGFSITISKNVLNHLCLEVVLHLTNTSHSLTNAWEITGKPFTGFLHLLSSTTKDPACFLTQ